ncbi:hypothetical protein [Pseudomonas sp. MWU12-2323]|uniref:hypothetical protein n=1 Tax=Pseudomonas sp. MWU12-2323 TaxID=2651296 RepID=UPI00128B3C57|nr:hypothetical protein [Pseudomonas sp. MWU12-2323]MPQ69257.1 hypothetical protein [Pseudomonas sp. MWU12-2323]
MQSTIHFYDAQFIGSPAQGQLVTFDSVACTATEVNRYGTQISLRADVAFNPQTIEQQDLYDVDLAAGVTEYEWSRKAQSLFEQPATLHVGLGNTSTVDHFIRYALYRCLSTLPNTELPVSAHFLDLLTICRAISVLRPQSMPIPINVDWSESRKRDYVFCTGERESRAECVLALARSLVAANPKLMAHAIAHSSPGQIATLCGLVDGHVESLSTLKPVFICHEQLMATRKYGFFLAMGTDPQYTNIIYVIDLQADLTALIEDGGSSVGTFIRTDASQTDKPIVRLNLNRVPFVSPMGVVDAECAKRLNIDLSIIKHNATLLHEQSDLCLALLEEFGASWANLSGDPDYQLFGAEYRAPDKSLIQRIHEASPADWDQILLGAHDARITALGMRLIRRCSPALLGEGETNMWRAHCAKRLIGKADPARIAATKEYCLGIAALTDVPKGMRAAALHWLNTIEIGNEPRINV